MTDIPSGRVLFGCMYRQGMHCLLGKGARSVVAERGGRAFT